MTTSPGQGYVIGEPRRQEFALLGTLTASLGVLSPVDMSDAFGGPHARAPTVRSEPAVHQDLMWLPDVYSLVARTELESAADLVFEHVDELLCAGDFRRCDELLQMVDVRRLDTNLMVSFLAVTLAAKQKLPSRVGLLRRVESRLQEIAPTRAEALLRPLR